MSSLSKWFPFKFKRKSKQAKADESPELPAQVQSSPSAHPAQRLFDSMLSDRFWRDPFSMFADSDRFFGDFSPRAFQPSIDVVDEGDHLRVSAELPGLDRDDIELKVHDGMVVISGEKKSETKTDEDGCYRLERYFGHFQRAVPLPADVDAAGAEANFDKGLLTVRFPKQAKADDGHRIEVR